MAWPLVIATAVSVGISVGTSIYNYRKEKKEQEEMQRLRRQNPPNPASGAYPVVFGKIRKELQRDIIYFKEFLDGDKRRIGMVFVLSQGHALRIEDLRIANFRFSELVTSTEIKTFWESSVGGPIETPWLRPYSNNVTIDGAPISSYVSILGIRARMQLYPGLFTQEFLSVTENAEVFEDFNFDIKRRGLSTLFVEIELPIAEDYDLNSIEIVTSRTPLLPFMNSDFMLIDLGSGQEEDLVNPVFVLADLLANSLYGRGFANLNTTNFNAVAEIVQDETIGISGEFRDEELDATIAHLLTVVNGLLYFDEENEEINIRLIRASDTVEHSFDDSEIVWENPVMETRVDPASRAKTLNVSYGEPWHPNGGGPYSLSMVGSFLGEVEIETSYPYIPFAFIASEVAKAELVFHSSMVDFVEFAAVTDEELLPGDKVAYKGETCRIVSIELDNSLNSLLTRFTLVRDLFSEEINVITPTEDLAPIPPTTPPLVWPIQPLKFSCPSWVFQRWAEQNFIPQLDLTENHTAVYSNAAISFDPEPHEVQTKETNSGFYPLHEKGYYIDIEITGSTFDVENLTSANYNVNSTNLDFSEASWYLGYLEIDQPGFIGETQPIFCRVGANSINFGYFEGGRAWKLPENVLIYVIAKTDSWPTSAPYFENMQRFSTVTTAIRGRAHKQGLFGPESSNVSNVQYNFDQKPYPCGFVRVENIDTSGWPNVSLDIVTRRRVKHSSLNPAQNSSSSQFTGSVTRHYSIHDSSGAVILNGPLNSNSVNVQDRISPGSYFLKVWQESTNFNLDSEPCWVVFEIVEP